MHNTSIAGWLRFLILLIFLSITGLLVYKNMSALPEKTACSTCPHKRHCETASRVNTDVVTAKDDIE